MTTNKRTPAEALMAQMRIISLAAEKLNETIDEITGSTNPDDATWADVERFAQIVYRTSRFLKN